MAGSLVTLYHGHVDKTRPTQNLLGAIARNAADCVCRPLRASESIVTVQMTSPSLKSRPADPNPTAGRRRRGLVDAVVRRVRAAGWTVDVVETTAAGDARRLAETCDASRYAVIAVAGGDGTINEVVNGLAGAATEAPPLGIVPLGTANVLAHELGLDFSAAAVAHTITRAGRCWCSRAKRAAAVTRAASR